MIQIDPTKIKYLLVHHSAVKAFHTPQSIKNTHIRWGLGDIAYHWVIDFNGKLTEGRKEYYVGAHSNTKKDGPSMNYQSIAVCVLGSYDLYDMTFDQKDTLGDWLDEKSAEYNILPDNIIGHCQIPYNTICPGEYILDWLSEYKERIKPKPELDKMEEQLNWIRRLILQIQRSLNKIMGK